MHEGAIAEALLEQVRAFLPTGAVLREIHIDVGRLEHLEPVVLETFWTALTKDEAEEGSVLVINSIPLSLVYWTELRDQLSRDLYDLKGGTQVVGDGGDELGLHFVEFLEVSDVSHNRHLAHTSDGGELGIKSPPIG